MSEIGQSRPHSNNGFPILPEETLFSPPASAPPPPPPWDAQRLSEPRPLVSMAKQPPSWLLAGAQAHIMPQPEPSTPWLSPPGHGQVTLLLAQALRNIISPSSTPPRTKSSRKLRTKGKIVKVTCKFRVKVHVVREL